MMSPDEVLDNIRKIMFFCKSESVSDMTDYLLCTFLRSKGSMIVYSRILILGKALRI